MFASVDMWIQYRKNKEGLLEWINGKDKKKPVICPDASFLEGFVDGHKKYRRIIPCDNEACSVCGQEGSILHRRRIIRGLSKILGVKILGYFVITFPEDVRMKLLDKYTLDKISKFVGRLIKQYQWCIGYVMRWHWGGDRNPRWHPHINILVNFHGQGWLPDKVLMNIREQITAWINKELGVNIPDIVMEYHYYKKHRQILHKWRYVTRPTMLLAGSDVWNLDIPEKLHNFRNSRWGGHWDNISEYEEKNLLFNGENIEWKYHSWFSPEEQLETLMYWEYLGYGVFRIVDTGTDPPLNKHKIVNKGA